MYFHTFSIDSPVETDLRKHDFSAISMRSFHYFHSHTFVCKTSFSRLSNTSLRLLCLSWNQNLYSSIFMGFRFFSTLEFNIVVEFNWKLTVPARLIALLFFFYLLASKSTKRPYFSTIRLLTNNFKPLGPPLNKIYTFNKIGCFCSDKVLCGPNET